MDFSQVHWQSEQEKHGSKSITKIEPAESKSSLSNTIEPSSTTIATAWRLSCRTMMILPKVCRSTIRLISEWVYCLLWIYNCKKYFPTGYALVISQWIDCHLLWWYWWRMRSFSNVLKKKLIALFIFISTLISAAVSVHLSQSRCRASKWIEWLWFPFSISENKIKKNNRTAQRVCLLLTAEFLLISESNEDFLNTILF